MITALLCLAAAPAFSADLNREVATAAAHAGMAAGAEDPQMVKAHLHHVLNCLSGPQGADYTAAAANPCDGQGAGAIPDATGERKSNLEKAAAMAKAALAESDIHKAKQQAGEVQMQLGK
jgi:hypothetical protein